MHRLATCAAALALIPLTASAFGPADYVYTPGVTYGEREIDLKGGSWKKPGEARERAWSIGLGYGVTQRWFTEIYRKYQSVGDQSLGDFDAWEWENKFQLTEPGEHFVDVGFLAEIERPKNRGEGYELRWGPLFQTEVGKVQLNGNLLFERHVRAEEPQHTQMAYQWQAKYRWRRELEFGLQGFGEMGPWDHWEPADQHSHRMGPAVFGRVALGNRQAIRYNAALLRGVSDAAPNQSFRFQVEYEF